MTTQSNVTPIADSARLLRQARGAFVKSLIEQEERSARFVAIRIGLNPTSMGERLKGKSPFLADELENIARVLRIDPVRFYARYITVGTQEGPTSEDAGPVAGVVHPLGLEPRTHWIRDSKVTSIRPRNRRDKSTGPKGRAA